MFNKKKIAELKGFGFLLQNDNEHFSVRFISKAGNFTTSEMESISKIANKYGKGYIGLTTRLSIEVPWINGNDIESVIKEAKELGLTHGGTGKKLRPLVACKGTICLHGNIDTQGICNKLAELHFAQDTPSKCKVTVTGCANNCSKASLNDIGIMGLTIPEFNLDKCVGCGMCANSCRQKALTIIDKKIVFDKSKCVDCGNCVRSCKLGAATCKKKGAQIYIGGRFGRSYRFGTNLGKVFEEDEICNAVEKILNYYIENGIPGERICHLMDRLGEEKVLRAICNLLDV